MSDWQCVNDMLAINELVCARPARLTSLNLPLMPSHDPLYSIAPIAPTKQTSPNGAL